MKRTYFQLMSGIFQTIVVRDEAEAPAVNASLPAANGIVVRWVEWDGHSDLPRYGDVYDFAKGTFSTPPMTDAQRALGKERAFERVRQARARMLQAELEETGSLQLSEKRAQELAQIQLDESAVVDAMDRVRTTWELPKIAHFHPELSQDELVHKRATARVATATDAHRKGKR